MVVSIVMATFESRLCQDTVASRIIPFVLEKDLAAREKRSPRTKKIWRGSLSFPYAGFAPSQSKPDLS